jgi:four helix bundle protein
MARHYTKIVAWQRAHELTVAVYRLTQAFPRAEMFGLTSQLRRASTSVAANIVEGSARNSKRDYLHFLNIAEASLRETEYLLLLARELDYMSEAQHQQMTGFVNSAFGPLHGLQRAVQKETGITKTLVALLASAIVIAIGRHAVAGVG